MKRFGKKFVFLLLIVGITTLYFSNNSVRKFVQKIAKSLSSNAEDQNTTYWCPMDPDIRRKKPGTCPV